MFVAQYDDRYDKGEMSYRKWNASTRSKLNRFIGDQRRRGDGSVSYTAQIALKKNGAFVRREAKNFDRKQAA